MAEISDLSSVDDSNTARFPEGMLMPQVNNSARALEGILARNFKDTNAATATQGTSTAYQVLTQRTIPSLAAGLFFMVRFHVACAASPTFQVNSLTAKPLKRQGGAALTSGDLAVNQIGLVVYNTATDTFECVGIGIPTRITGQATFSSASTVAVTLNPAQSDANYILHIEPNGNYNFWPTSKTTTGFTINCSATQSGSVNWSLAR